MKHWSRFYSVLFFVISLSDWSLVLAGPGDGFFYFNDAKTGTAVLPFLKLPVGARAMAMGSFEGPTLEDPGALFWNPAAVPYVRGFQTQFTHAEIYDEFRHEGAATVFPAPWIGNVGLGFGGVFTTPFEGARDIEENENDLQAMDFSVGLAWGMPFWHDRVAAGAKVSWYHSQLDDVPGDGYGFDLGIQWVISAGLRGSAAFQNLAHHFSYRSGTDTQEKVPAVLRVGLGFADTISPWAWTLGYSKSNDGYQRFHLGGEWNWRQTFFLRGGYEWNPHQPELGWDQGLGAGIGVRLSTLGLDYGVRSQGYLGLVHAVTFKVHPALHWYQPKNYLEEARKAWKKGSCEEVIHWAKLAVRQDPTQLDAVVLIQACEKESQRQNQDVVTFALSANTEGQFQAFYEGEQLMGGLSRRATVLQQLRLQSPQMLYLDAGQMLSAQALIPHLDSLPSVLHDLKLDAVLANPVARSRLDSLPPPLPWLSTWPVQEGVPQSVQIQRGKRRIGLFAVGPDIQGNLPQTTDLSQAIQTQREQWNQFVDLEVLLLDGTVQQAQDLVIQIPGLDLIVLSGKQRLLPRPLLQQGTWIVAPGRRGMTLGVAEAQWGKNQEAQWTFRTLFLDERIRPDSSVASLFEEAWQSTEQEHWEVPPLERESFVFVQPIPDTREDLWLYEASKGKSLRLTRHPGKIRMAQMAWSRQLVAYLDQADSTGGSLFLQKTTEKERFAVGGDTGKVTSLTWEPYENWLYFTRTNSQGQGELFRVTWKGTHRMNISQGRWGDIQKIVFSPQGKQLAFYSRDQGRHRIYFSSYTLTAPMSLGPDSLDVYAPAFSPNGKQIAFLAGNPEQGGDLWLWDRQIDQLRPLTQSRRIQSFTWSADGQEILLHQGINVLDAFRLDLKTLEEFPLLQQGDFVRQLLRSKTLRRQGQEGYLLEMADQDGKRFLRFFSPQTGLQSWLDSTQQTYFGAVE